jgi:hypothetical protein
VVNNHFVVALKHEVGSLAALAELLADRDIDIRSIGAAGIGTQGCAVFTTSNDALARSVLRDAKLKFVESEVLTVIVEDQPGSLARVARKLADAGINIHAVLVTGRRQGKAELACSVDDVALAQRALV